MAYGETYEQFVKKFEPKKTTDDCYTPDIVYDAVADYVARKYELDRGAFVRPFWPGGDYQAFEYPEGCVVVDNPPFSIFTKIVDFYAKHDIKFFLFAPSLTCISSGITVEHACAIPLGVSVTYSNGAEVNTGFVTNLEPDLVVKSDPELYRILADADAELRKEIRKQVPKYEYPDYVVTAAKVQFFARYGEPFEVKRGDCVRIRRLDAQADQKKSIFGGGLLLSEKAAAEKAAAEKAAAEKAAAEKAAAEKAAAEKAAAMTWGISARERAIIGELGN